MLDAVDTDTSTHSALGTETINTLTGTNRCMVSACRLDFTTQSALAMVIMLCQQHMLPQQPHILMEEEPQLL